MLNNSIRVRLINPLKRANVDLIAIGDPIPSFAPEQKVVNMDCGSQAIPLRALWRPPPPFQTQRNIHRTRAGFSPRRLFEGVVVHRVGKVVQKVGARESTA